MSLELLVETNEDGFRYQPDPECIFNALPNLPGQPDNVRRLSVTAIDERQCVLTGYACAADSHSFFKSGSFDQPCCGGFYGSSPRRIPRNGLLCVTLNPCVLRFAEDGILKKRTCAATIRVAFNDEHALGSTNLTDSVSNFRQGRLGLSFKTT